MLLPECTPLFFGMSPAYMHAPTMAPQHCRTMYSTECSTAGASKHVLFRVTSGCLESQWPSRGSSLLLASPHPQNAWLPMQIPQRPTTHVHAICPRQHAHCVACCRHVGRTAVSALGCTGTAAAAAAAGRPCCHCVPFDWRVVSALTRIIAGDGHGKGDRRVEVPTTDVGAVAGQAVWGPGSMITRCNVHPKRCQPPSANAGVRG
jgi:hypothetical protein